MDGLENKDTDQVILSNIGSDYNILFKHQIYTALGTKNMDGKIKRSRRSRSQRDRVRRKDAIDNVQNRSPSSGSDRGQSSLGSKAMRNNGTHSDLHHDRHPRPPRKKIRGSRCQEEDIIDGFAIASFLSLDNLEVRWLYVFFDKVWSSLMWG